MAIPVAAAKVTDTLITARSARIPEDLTF